MRIAQIAPLFESVPPRRYGGTERVVHWLVENLARRGHDVTLFASGDSRTSARLVPICPEALRRGGASPEPTHYDLLQLGRVYGMADRFDVIHSHCELRALPFAGLVATPTVSTDHNRLDTPDVRALWEAYPMANLVSISDSQRHPLPDANWLATVYNGVPIEEFPYSSAPGEYLVFLGRMSPEKGPVAAIEVARRAGLPLRIAARVNAWEREYFDRTLASLLATPGVEFLGEVGDAEKKRLLAGARALLFPVNWPEPFGLVMIEAMACGTPVIAFDRGAAAEVVQHEATGFVCGSVDEMVDAVRWVAELDRQACRARVAECFSADAMTGSYEAVYRALSNRR